MLFCDVDGKRIPRRCVMELQKQTYCLIGKIIAFSLIHGGPAQYFLARPVIDYIVYGKASPRPSDVPEQHIREALLKVS